MTSPPDQMFGLTDAAGKKYIGAFNFVGNCPILVGLAVFPWVKPEDCIWDCDSAEQLPEGLCFVGEGPGGDEIEFPISSDIGGLGAPIKIDGEFAGFLCKFDPDDTTDGDTQVLLWNGSEFVEAPAPGTYELCFPPNVDQRCVKILGNKIVWYDNSGPTISPHPTFHGNGAYRWQFKSFVKNGANQITSPRPAVGPFTDYSDQVSAFSAETAAVDSDGNWTAILTTPWTPGHFRHWQCEIECGKEIAQYGPITLCRIDEKGNVKEFTLTPTIFCPEPRYAIECIEDKVTRYYDALTRAEILEVNSACVVSKDYVEPNYLGEPEQNCISSVGCAKTTIFQDGAEVEVELDYIRSVCIDALGNLSPIDISFWVKGSLNDPGGAVEVDPNTFLSTPIDCDTLQPIEGKVPGITECEVQKLTLSVSNFSDATIGTITRPVAGFPPGESINGILVDNFLAALAPGVPIKTIGRDSRCVTFFGPPISGTIVGNGGDGEIPFASVSLGTACLDTVAIKGMDLNVFGDTYTDESTAQELPCYDISDCPRDVTKLWFGDVELVTDQAYTTVEAGWDAFTLADALNQPSNNPNPDLVWSAKDENLVSVTGGASPGFINIVSGENAKGIPLIAGSEGDPPKTYDVLGVRNRCMEALIKVQNGLLADILACQQVIKDEIVCDCPEGNLDQITTDEAGVTVSDPAEFPHITPETELEEIVSTFSLPRDGCLEGADPATIMCVRVDVLGHDVITAANGTTGFNLQGPPSAQLDSWSATNTISNTANVGTNLAAVGTTQAGRDLADRWVKYLIPLGDLQNGVVFNTSALGGVNPTGVTETVRELNFTVTDLDKFCEDCK